MPLELPASFPHERLLPKVSMKTFVVIGHLCWLLVYVGLLSPAVAGQPEDVEPLRAAVTVEPVEGRSFTAKVDRRTDDRQLWLRWSRGSAHLLRPIRWDRIRRVHVGQETLTGEQFRRRVEAARPEVIPVPAKGPPWRIDSKGAEYPGDARTAAATRAAPGRGPAAWPPLAAPEARRVRSLAIDVAVANWDADVEVDGLIVDVYPLDADGQVVPVRGVLEVDLIVQRWGVVKRPQPFIRRGRWTEPVRTGHFGSSGARYRLPFGAAGFHPEFDSRAAPHGAVHAQLSVPGQGVFAASQSMVRIRPYSAVRDALERATGKRFFPQEKTGGGRR